MSACPMACVLLFDRIPTAQKSTLEAETLECSSLTPREVEVRRLRPIEPLPERNVPRGLRRHRVNETDYCPFCVRIELAESPVCGCRQGGLSSRQRGRAITMADMVCARHAARQG
jgi:hypothetical protein